MNKKEARELLQEHVESDGMVQYSIAVSKVMEHLAEKLGEDVEKWEVTGLLHAIDYEETKDLPEQKSKRAAEMLKQKGLEEEIYQAVERHNEEHELPRETNLDKALYCVVPTTDLIVATVRMHPDESISALDKNTVLERYEEPAFVSDVNRYQIAGSQELGVDLEEFIELALSALQDSSEDLGL